MDTQEVCGLVSPIKRLCRKLSPYFFPLLFAGGLLVSCAWPAPVNGGEKIIIPYFERPLVSYAQSWKPLPLPEFTYPVGRLFITAERDAYESGSMTLEIPRIQYNGPVLGGVDDHTLTLGIGLYTYSPLPGEKWQNANVSIAGHRDIYGSEFYYIDTITDGDELYLTYNNAKYTYVYQSTAIVEDTEWSVIHCTGYPTLTLTSCDPIGTSDYRIVVKGLLTKVELL